MPAKIKRVFTKLLDAQSSVYEPMALSYRR
jgi:hypothetical protein